jgi:hypothetical protein
MTRAATDAATMSKPTIIACGMIIRAILPGAGRSPAHEVRDHGRGFPVHVLGRDTQDPYRPDKSLSVKLYPNG